MRASRTVARPTLLNLPATSRWSICSSALKVLDTMLEEAAGAIDVTSASVSVNGKVVNLHNPNAYAGTYNCGANVCATFSLPPEFAGPLMCLDRPLGSPSAECGFFGLNPQGGDAGGAASQLATQNAALAIVKNGTVGCGGGDQAYRFYSPVSVGDLLQQPNYPNGGGISHVTYCACPAP